MSGNCSANSMSALASGLSAAQEFLTSNIVASNMLVGLPVVAALVVFTIAWVDLRRKTSKPVLSYQPTPFNLGVMSRMPTLKQVYKPMLGLTNGHVETIFAAKFRWACPLDYRREKIFMPDGGLVCLDWRCTPAGEAGMSCTMGRAQNMKRQELDKDAAVLVLLPGLTGGSDDTYVRYAVQYAHSIGIRAVVFNSRGCGDTFLSTPQFYSGLFIEDLKHVIAHVQNMYPNSQLFATGWSLGANILVNYLGLVGKDTPIAAASALCNPFNLVIGDTNMRKGFNQVYNRNLASAMSRIMRRNKKVWNGATEFDVETACNASSIREWDEAITRVSFGFPTVDAYYAAAGSDQRVPDVKIPLLVLQAEDDPIAPIEATPKDALYANPNCILAVTPTGGHLGWCSGEGGYFSEPWTDRIIVEWLQACQLQIAMQGAKPSTSAASPGNGGPGGNGIERSTPALASQQESGGAGVPEPTTPDNNGSTRSQVLSKAGSAYSERRKPLSVSTLNSAKSLEAALHVSSESATDKRASAHPSSTGANLQKRPLSCFVPEQPLQADQFSGGYTARQQSRFSIHARGATPRAILQSDQYTGGYPPQSPLQSSPSLSTNPVNLTVNLPSAAVSTVARDESPELQSLEQAMEAMYRRVSPNRPSDARSLAASEPLPRGSRPPSPPSLRSAVGAPGQLAQSVRQSPGTLWWSDGTP